MQHVEILIQTKEDSKVHTKPLIDGIESDPIHGHITHAIIFEGGLKSGKTSVAFVAKSDDESKNKSVILEISAEVLNIINSATEGANKRFELNKSKKNQDYERTK